MGGCGESGRNPGFLLSLIPSRFSFFKKRKCRKPGGPCNRVARRVYPRGQEHVGACRVWGPQHDPARARGRRPSFRLALLPGSPRAPRPLSRPCCPRGQVASPGRAALKRRKANDAAVPGRLRDSKATEPARQSEATARETPASRCCGPGGGARRSSGLWPPAPPRPAESPDGAGKSPAGPTADDAAAANLSTRAILGSDPPDPTCVARGRSWAEGRSNVAGR